MSRTLRDIPPAPATPEEWHKLMLQFIGSLVLCDHMGDVSNKVDEVLIRIHDVIEWDDFPDLRRALSKRGVTTLLGTELWSEDDDA